jgi:hypothetical protein
MLARQSTGSTNWRQSLPQLNRQSLGSKTLRSHENHFAELAGRSEEDSEGRN